MIFFVRSYIADFDARLGKYFDALAAAGLPHYFIGWNKDGAVSEARQRQTLFRLKARLGGGWSNAVALVQWNVFVFLQLCRARRSVSIVHVIDLDSALPTWVFCKIFRKRLVFDLYDKYTAVRNISGMPGRLLDALETAVARSADLTVIVSEERLAQHGLQDAQARVLVLENVPGAIAVTPISRKPSGPPWKIGYFGVLEPRNRGLEHLLDACSARSDVQLHVAGYGGLAETFSAAASKFANIRFYGPTTSAEGLSLMAQMDVIVGMYYLTVPNHAFASPNKYYEHLMLRRGMLSTAGTPPGAKVVREGSGWAIPEGREAIDEWLEDLDDAQIQAAGVQAGRVWHEKYSSYYFVHYRGEYIRRIKGLLGRKENGPS